MPNPGVAPGARGRPRWLAPNDVLIVYAMLFALMAGTFVIGLKGVGLIRPVFILGAVFVAWRAWRIGPGLHAEVLIFLFTLSPFLRRVVDAHTSYNASGIMLLAPLLALCLPILEVRRVLLSRQNFSIYTPYLIMLACITYGWSYASFQNKLAESGVEAVKMLLPMLYAVYLVQRNDGCADIIEGVGRAFLVVGPFIGIYGVIQWLNPPEWDRYWMIYSQMKSIGYPEPRQVRVFSTMNSPASFAMFAACGLLIFSYCRRGWLPVMLVLPIGIGVLLSAVRMSWIVIAITVAFATLFGTTRQRSGILTISLFGAVAAALLLTPAGDVIGSRLSSLGSSPGQDGSAQARMQQYMYVYSNLDQYLFGSGFGNYTHDAKLEHIDGQLLASATSMGIVIGNVHVLCIIWAALQGLGRVTLRDKPLQVVTAAMVIGFLVLLPLETVSSGEVSFLFWLFVGVMSSTPPRRLRSLVPAASSLRADGSPQGLRPQGLRHGPPRAPALGLTIGR